MKKPIIALLLVIIASFGFANVVTTQKVDSSTASYAIQKPLSPKPIAQNLSARTTEGDATVNLTTTGTVVNNYYTTNYYQPSHSERFSEQRGTQVAGGNYLHNPLNDPRNPLLVKMASGPEELLKDFSRKFDTPFFATFLFGILVALLVEVLIILRRRFLGNFQLRWPFARKA